MRNRVPIVYLVDSAGVNLPLQDGIFPGQYGAARIFYYNSLMRRRLHVPQIAAVMGPCIAGGAYLPALSDVIIMVEGTSFMGLGGPNLVKGAVGQVVDAESLGGARMHTTASGVAHFMAKDDAACLELIRERFRAMPAAPSAAARNGAGEIRRRLVRLDARRSPAALQHGGRDRSHLRSRRLPGVSAWARAGAAVRGREARWPAGGAGRESARISEDREAARASAALCTRSRRAKWRTSSKTPSGTTCR